ncbi:MAG TPA: diguanylate cyclase [Kofleriaceae bacterium]|nr:diguanylate cyclase [Kofleriaceae bacterium]
MRVRSLERAARVAGGATASALACALVAAGGTTWGGPASHTAAAATAWVTLVAIAAAVRRMRFTPPSARLQRVSFWMRIAPAAIDIEVSLALIAGCGAAVQATGGQDSPLYPLVYGVVAFAAAFQTRAAALLAIVGALALEAAAAARAGFAPAAVAAALLHAGFITSAALMHALFLRGLFTRLRRDHAVRVEDELRRRRESSRDYRLIAAALGAESRGPRARPDEEEALVAGSAEVIGASIVHTLDLVKRALSARTAVLLWLDERGDGLRIKEAQTDVDWIACGARVPLAGALGAAVRDRALVSLPHARPGQVPYYDGGGSEAGGPLVALPVCDGPHVRGLLCADRAPGAAAFGDRDADFLARAGQQIVHAIHAEHVFIAVERAKYEHERFYHASARLGRALTLDQVMDTAFEAASEIVDCDLAVITLFQPENRRHRVYSARHRPGVPPLVGPLDLAGLEFRDNAGLVSMVVKNRHYLPASGELRDDAIPVWTRKVKLRGAESLLVLPLVSADEAIGTLTLASRERHRFRKDVREMLGVIANQVATSLQNAMMYKKMETMATTDGLTGLTNHRTFQERFAQLLERSARHGHKAAMLLLDIDHFKKVNDTYGHPIGDEVLRQVAQVLGKAVRVIDIPARYGGEEFAVVLESTDLPGALNLAERIREDVGRLEVPTDKGPLTVTTSIGVAAFPDDATEQPALIERADMALYHAKQGGRNRVVSYRDFSAERSGKTRAAS